jgi:hypothetical protein
LRYGHRLVYDAGGKVEARLASVLKRKVWCWPAARSDEMAGVQSKLCMVKIGKNDQPVLVILKKGNYCCSDTWNASYLAPYAESRLVECSLVLGGHSKACVCSLHSYDG